jgi:hypothetical protein
LGNAADGSALGLVGADVPAAAELGVDVPPAISVVGAGAVVDDVLAVLTTGSVDAVDAVDAVAPVVDGVAVLSLLHAAASNDTVMSPADHNGPLRRERDVPCTDVFMFPPLPAVGSPTA